MQLLQQMQKVKQSNDNKRRRAEIAGKTRLLGLIRIPRVLSLLGYRRPSTTDEVLRTINLRRWQTIPRWVEHTSTCPRTEISAGIRLAPVHPSSALGTLDPSQHVNSTWRLPACRIPSFLSESQDIGCRSQKERLKARRTGQIRPRQGGCGPQVPRMVNQCGRTR